MASITYRGPRQWLVCVRRKGFPLQSKTLDTKAQAEAWVRQIEGEMDRGVFVSRAEAERTTLAEALERYMQEYLPQLKHPYREISRAQWIQRQPLATMSGTYAACVTRTSGGTDRGRPEPEPQRALRRAERATARQYYLTAR